MHALIRPFVERLKNAGFVDEIIPEHWGEEWRERKWLSVFAEDGSILEVVEANRYTRITAHREPRPGHPFHCLQYVSAKYQLRPKTEFFNGLHDGAFEFLDEHGVLEKLSAPA